MLLSLRCSLPVAFAAAQPEVILHPRKLPPCPQSPNCVSSQSADPKHRISPIAYHSAPEEAFQRIKKVIQSFPRAKITLEEELYLKAEFRSLILRFVDDVEISVDAVDKVIHIRSASRAGYWDLGVNRRRVERIRGRFKKAS